MRIFHEFFQSMMSSLLVILIIFPTFNSIVFDHDVNELIMVYKQYHSSLALQRASTQFKSDFCARKYVVMKMSCNSLGNSFAPFINGFSLALITNRTFITEDLVKCYSFLKFSDWIPSHSWVKSLRKSTECKNTIKQVPFKSHDVAMFRCCGVENNTDAIIAPTGSIFNAAFDWFHKYSGAVLSSRARRVADVIFKNPYGIGRFVSYGILQQYLLVFSHEIHWAVNPILDEIFSNVQNQTYHNDTLVLGVHARHRHVDKLGVSIEETMDNRTLDLIPKILDLHPHKKCVMLIATDRNHSLALLETTAYTVGCTPRYINRNNSSSLHARRAEKPPHHLEHGPWSDGFLQIADWYLLMHAEYFIGLEDSTFSWAMADTIAARAISQGRENPLYWTTENIRRKYAGDDESLWTSGSPSDTELHKLKLVRVYNDTDFCKKSFDRHCSTSLQIKKTDFESDLEEMIYNAEVFSSDAEEALAILKLQDISHNNHKKKHHKQGSV